MQQKHVFCQKKTTKQNKNGGFMSTDTVYELNK